MSQINLSSTKYVPKCRLHDDSSTLVVTSESTQVSMIEQANFSERSPDSANNIVSTEVTGIIPSYQSSVHAVQLCTGRPSQQCGQASIEPFSRLHAVHEETYDNGYHFPPKRPFLEAFLLSFKDFSKYCATPLGAFVVLYCLNVVAWGGMLFLLLCNAAPAMCNPNCDDIDSPRRRWIEYDSQIIVSASIEIMFSSAFSII